MSYDDTQRTSIIDDEEELPKKQEEFRKILEDLDNIGRATTLLNYYKTWSRAYSVSEKLLAYCILLIYKQTTVRNLNWKKISTGLQTKKIIESIARIVQTKKDVDQSETKLKLQLNIIRYLRLAEQFLGEADADLKGEDAPKKLSVSELGGSEEEEEGEEAPE